MYKINYSKQATKDIEKLKQSNLSEKAKELVKTIKNNPYQYPPKFEKLEGNLQGFVSRRINQKHRIVYKVDEENKTVNIYSMWTHYENI